jgi:hypothetical protein
MLPLIQPYLLNNMFNVIFYRAYKYYGEDNGLINATILLAALVLLFSFGFYNILYKCFNQYGDAFGLLDNRTERIKFRLIFGPLIVITIQQVIYWFYRYKNYYLKTISYYDGRKNTHFVFRNAHFISFISAVFFLMGSFFIGDLLNKLIYQ